MMKCMRRHVDHIGNLEEVTEAFPDAQVAMHILEAPYVAGGVSYGTVCNRASNNTEWEFSGPARVAATSRAKALELKSCLSLSA